jgi:hypothetical protein
MPGNYNLRTRPASLKRTPPKSAIVKLISHYLGNTMTPKSSVAWALRTSYLKATKRPYPAWLSTF